MKHLPFFVIALAFTLLVTSAGPASAQSTYEIDASHSQVIFKVEHLGVSNNYGRFNAIEGTLKWDASKPESSMIEVKIPAASVDTGNEKRDQHLRSNDFFSAKQFPAIIFKSKKITKKSDNMYTVTGDLTLRGVTKSITTEFEYVGEGKDPWGGYRAGGEAKLEFKRSDFGMDFMLDNNSLGDTVTVMINIEAIRK